MLRTPGVLRLPPWQHRRSVVASSPAIRPEPARRTGRTSGLNGRPTSRAMIARHKYGNSSAPPRVTPSHALRHRSGRSHATRNAASSEGCQQNWVKIMKNSWCGLRQWQKMASPAVSAGFDGQANAKANEQRRARWAAGGKPPRGRGCRCGERRNGACIAGISSLVERTHRCPGRGGMPGTPARSRRRRAPPDR